MCAAVPCTGWNGPACSCWGEGCCCCCCECSQWDRHMICLLRYGGGCRFDTASSHTCTVHCMRAGILCTSGLEYIVIYSATFLSSYVASNGRMTNEWWIAKDVEGSSWGLIVVLFWNLPGWAEENHEEHVGFKVITAMVMKSTIFWVIMLCSPLTVNRCFGGKYRLHLQGRKNKLRKKPPAFTLVFCSVYFFRPRRWYSSWT
jgi:hypothetical protein